MKWTCIVATGLLACLGCSSESDSPAEDEAAVVATPGEVRCARLKTEVACLDQGDGQCAWLDRNGGHVCGFIDNVNAQPGSGDPGVSHEGEVPPVEEEPQPPPAEPLPPE